MIAALAILMRAACTHHADQGDSRLKYYSALKDYQGEKGKRVGRDDEYDADVTLFNTSCLSGLSRREI